MMSKKESGFTLIEIVMVLVLLGILMAVAAPKYFDMQEKAREQAENAIAAEVQARLNGEFAQRLLAGETCSKAREGAVDAVVSGGSQVTSPDGEWTVTVADVTDDDAATTTATILWTGETTGTPKNIAVPVCGAYAPNP